MAQNFIDISNHQSSIRIRDVPTDAVIVKATEGRGWRDRSMPGFVAQSRSADKPLGFYHFVSQGNTPVQEADNLLAYTDGHRRDNDVMVLDWEPIGSNPGTRNVDWARRFLEHLTGRCPNPVWTYMNLSTANASDWTPVTGRWPYLWLAHYPGNNKANGYRPAGSRGTLQGRNAWKLAAWQFTDGGRLSGFGGNLDLNELYIPWWTGKPADPYAPVTKVIVPSIPVIRESDPPVHFYHHHGGRVNKSNGSPRLGCVCMAMTFPLIEKEMIKRGLIKHQIDVFQGGYNKGGVAASAGTHDMGGVIDVAQGITLAQRRVWAMFGVMMFPRTRQYGWNTGDHGHGVWHGCPHQTVSADRQVTSGINGRDGLVGNRLRNFEAPTRVWQDAYREYARETITITQEEDEPVATPHTRATTINHPGGPNPVLPGDEFKALPTTGQAVTGVARAILSAPEGVTLRTRWVSWSGRDDPGWVRQPILDHATSRIETTEIIDQAWAGADLQLDVWASEPCQIEIVLSSLTSPKR